MNEVMLEERFTGNLRCSAHLTDSFSMVIRIFTYNAAPQWQTKVSDKNLFSHLFA